MVPNSLYFAYGSNLGQSVFKTRCPGARQVGIARADGYRIGFTRKSKVRRGGVADLVSAPESTVWGALFELCGDDFAALDKCEGTPTAYKREIWELSREDGSPVSAWVYVVVTKEKETEPSYDYWRLLVDGAKEAGLPVTYIDFLERLPHLSAK
jgi:cation transport regulator ChaC